MTNSEVSDQILKDFNSANWDGWKSAIADNAKMEDMATGQVAEGADACLAYAQQWKSMYPDMIGTLIIGLNLETHSLRNALGWEPILEKSRCLTGLKFQQQENL